LVVSVVFVTLLVGGCLAPYAGRKASERRESSGSRADSGASDTVSERSTTEIDPTQPVPITLESVLELAGANNIDIEIVAQRIEEAKAGVDAARAMYLPDLRLGVGYTRHDGRLQETRGEVFDVSRQSGGAGPELSLFVDPAEAHFERLRAIQLAVAAEREGDRTRAETIVRSAILYLGLVRASALVEVANDAVERSRAHVDLQKAAVEADAILQVFLARALAQLARDEHGLLAAQQEEKRARTELAVWLRLPPRTNLVLSSEEILPVTLVEDSAKIDDLIDSALAHGPDLAELQALELAADAQLASAEWGPLLPEANLHTSYGAYAGGRNNYFGSLGDRLDVGVGISWTLRGFGLGDRARRRAARARSISAALEREKLEDIVRAEVLDSWHRASSLLARIDASRQRVQAAKETQNLVQARFEAGDAIQLEVLEAVREHASARAMLVDAIVGYNQNQHLLFYRVRGAAWSRAR
jgi:outer membrane protein TolC